MPRPTGPYGPGPYLAATGQSIYDADPTTLPPVTRAVRAAFGQATSPVPSADVIAALLVAVNTLETRLIALGG